MAAACLVVAAGAMLTVYKVRTYNQAADQANIVEIRELVLLAIRGLKKDAPVDPRTGDVYFPESGLYLPNPHMTLPFTYLWDTGDVTNAQSQLSISTYPVFGTTRLYTARNNMELFAAIPAVQACSRGIKVVTQKFAQDDTQNVLKHTVHLDNGKDVYIYLEKDCPQLATTADALANIRSF